MQRLAILAALLVAALTGCATTPPPPPQTIWMRTDGRQGAGNPAMLQQFEVAKTVCVGEMQKTNMSGVTVSASTFDAMMVQINRNAAAMDALKGCMATQRYVLVPADQVEQLAAAARAAAASPSPLPVVPHN
jgi:hypothetical protein